MRVNYRTCYIVPPIEAGVGHRKRSFINVVTGRCCLFQVIQVKLGVNRKSSSEKQPINSPHSMQKPRCW